MDQWYIEGKQGVIDDFKQALAQNYVWRSNPPPPISFIADQLPKHPTKVWEQRSLPEITHIVVHSTASPANVSAERIADYHVQTMGWPGIGYHFIIGPSGAIEQTNPLEAASFHTSGAEDFSIGIAFAGSFDDAIPTPEQIESGARLIAWLMAELNIPIEQVMGHKEMPGNATKDPRHPVAGGPTVEGHAAWPGRRDPEVARTGFGADGNGYAVGVTFYHSRSQPCH